MTHGPETGTINRLHFSDADFWYVCRANLGPDSSGTRFRCSLFYYKPESGVCMTEMMACDWMMIIVDVSSVLWSCFMQCCYLFIYVIFSYWFIYSARNFHSRCTRNKKLAPKTGSCFRRRKMESIYGASFCSMCHGPNTPLLVHFCNILCINKTYEKLI